MQKVIFRVNVAENTLTGPDGNFHMKHYQAGRFLAALVESEGRNIALSCSAFAIHWNGSPTATGPDRTALRRVVGAAQDALLNAGSSSRITWPLRSATVGPWRLKIGENERWSSVVDRVATPASAGLASGSRKLCLTRRSTPAEMLAALAVFVVADDLARQALYTDAIDYLAEREACVNFSAEGKALVALRKARWFRRMDRHKEARIFLDHAVVNGRIAHEDARAALLAECALLEARLAYDANPMENARRINFSRLGGQIDQYVAPHLTWEAANLQALAGRRQMQVLLAKGRGKSPAVLLGIAQRVIDCFSTAFYWLTAVSDPYHFRAVLVNYAYHMQWIIQQRSAILHVPAIEDVMEAWRLSQSVVEKFDLPEDNAWVYIMLADFWLRQPSARHQIRSDWRLWPKQRSPANSDFYQRCVELADSSGDPRQKVFALDRSTAFFLESGDAKQAEKLLRRRDAVLAADSELARQLSGEGLWGMSSSQQR